MLLSTEHSEATEYSSGSSFQVLVFARHELAVHTDLSFQGLSCSSLTTPGCGDPAFGVALFWNRDGKAAMINVADLRRRGSTGRILAQGDLQATSLLNG